MQSLFELARDAISRNWKRALLAIVSVAVFVVAWNLYSSYLDANLSGYREYVPAPAEVVEAFIDSFQTPGTTGLLMTDHIFASLKRVFLGFVLALALAVPSGLLMGRYPVAEGLGMPIVEIFRPIPPIAWIPVFSVVLGYLWGPIAIVFLGIFFPVLYNIMLGVKSVDPLLVDAAKTLGAERKHIFFKVILPFTTPYLMTGIKVGLGIGWMCIVAAEMVGAYGGGVGFYIWDTAESKLFDYAYAGIAVIAILGILTTGVASQVERRLYAWMGMK
ncbi:MAG: ABC transporter permease [Methanobacteriota archaeon]|nr:MAG: ABC transporter permease [Euryarchaeota archaeon]